jgi:hypothetical protein
VFAVRSSAVSADVRSTLTRLFEAGAVRLPLGPLPTKAVSEMTADRLDAQADPSLLRLAGHSGGNPFLLVELLDGLREEGLVRVEHGRAELLDELLPARVREGMRDRLEGVSTEAREAVQLAAVLGRRFSVDRLALVGGSSPPALLGPVAELMGADLVAEVEGRLEFRHDLVREAVLATIPVSMRVALQRHAAEVLLNAGASAAEVAPLLLASAGPGDTAAVATLRAAGPSRGGRRDHHPGLTAGAGRRPAPRRAGRGDGAAAARRRPAGRGYGLGRAGVSTDPAARAGGGGPAEPVHDVLPLARRAHRGQPAGARA